MRIVEELSSFYRHIYLNLPGFTRLVGVAGAGAPLRFGVFPANLYKLGEPTSGLESLYGSLRVIIHVLQGFAQGCESPIFKGFSFLRLAPCCTALRSRWCQSGVKRCQEFGRWRSHVFLRSLLVPATLSKRGIPPFDRFKLLFGQPFAYFGFEAEGGEEVREHHHVLEPWGLREQEV